MEANGMKIRGMNGWMDEWTNEHMNELNTLIKNDCFARPRQPTFGTCSFSSQLLTFARMCSRLMHPAGSLMACPGASRVSNCEQMRHLLTFAFICSHVMHPAGSLVTCRGHQMRATVGESGQHG